MSKDNLDYLNAESDDLEDRKKVRIWSKWKSYIQSLKGSSTRDGH